MYNKAEILRRRDAVGINVRSHFYIVVAASNEFVQDIRDLVLHVAADAPPPSWVRVGVRSAFITATRSLTSMSRIHAPYKKWSLSSSPA